MTAYIWDTGALTLFFVQHAKAKKIMKEIVSGHHQGFVPRIVLTEFFYKTWQKFGEQAAQIQTINTKEVLTEIATNEEDIFRIGALKVKNPLLSMVDATILHLSKKVSATILTTDQAICDVYGYRSQKLIY